MIYLFSAVSLYHNMTVCNSFGLISFPVILCPVGWMCINFYLRSMCLQCLSLHRLLQWCSWRPRFPSLASWLEFRKTVSSMILAWCLFCHFRDELEGEWLLTIDFHFYLMDFFPQWKPMVTIYCLHTNIFHNIVFCVQTIKKDMFELKNWS